MVQNSEILYPLHGPLHVNAHWCYTPGLCHLFRRELQSTSQEWWNVELASNFGEVIFQIKSSVSHHSIAWIKLLVKIRQPGDFFIGCSSTKSIWDKRNCHFRVFRFLYELKVDACVSGSADLSIDTSVQSSTTRVLGYRLLNTDGMLSLTWARLGQIGISENFT